MADECTAVIWHGPGHQSKGRCEVTGDHERTSKGEPVHQYRGPRNFYEWTGDEVHSGFFDESPDPWSDDQ